MKSRVRTLTSLLLDVLVLALMEQSRLEDLTYLAARPANLFPYLAQLLSKLVLTLKRGWRTQTLRIPPILLGLLHIGYQVLMLYQLFQVRDLIALPKLYNQRIYLPAPLPLHPMHPLLPRHRAINLSLPLQPTIVFLVLPMQDTCAVLLPPHTQVPKMYSPLSVPHTMIPNIVRHKSSEHHLDHQLLMPHLFSLPRLLVLRLSSPVIPGIHQLVMTNNIHYRTTGLMSASPYHNTLIMPGYGVPMPRRARQPPQRTFQ